MKYLADWIMKSAVHRTNFFPFATKVWNDDKSKSFTKQYNAFSINAKKKCMDFFAATW